MTVSRIPAFSILTPFVCQTNAVIYYVAFMKLESTQFSAPAAGCRHFGLHIFQVCILHNFNCSLDFTFWFDCTLTLTGGGSNMSTCPPIYQDGS
jgi:hypothetical protein